MSEPVFGPNARKTIYDTCQTVSRLKKGGKGIDYPTIIGVGKKQIMRAKAKLYTGTWETLKSYTESFDGTQPITTRQWSFNTGTFSFSTIHPYAQQGFTADDPTNSSNYVTAYNVLNGYIMENMIYTLKKVDGVWTVEEPCWPTRGIISTGTPTLNNANNHLVTVSTGNMYYQADGTHQIRCYGDFIQSTKSLGNPAYVACIPFPTLWHETGVFEWRYSAIASDRCPV